LQTVGGGFYVFIFAELYNLEYKKQFGIEMLFLCSSPETGLPGGTVGTECSLASRGALEQGNTA
jgi:hypothetical protein